MQVDMHYYGTYAIALAAGIPDKDAEVIAYAAQYVDDATSEKNGEHKDGGRLVTFSTAHHISQSAATMFFRDIDAQRKIWVPNHFIPGGIGKSFEEKTLCSMDSDIARTMFNEHILYAKERFDTYGLELIGITVHAYMDTFSHYGFSGFSSKYNRIKQGSIKPEEIDAKNINADVLDKMKKGNAGGLAEKYLTNVKSMFAEGGNAALGHGAVLTLPDMPYLTWEFDFEIARPENGTHSYRDNKKNYLKAAEQLHAFLSLFAKLNYAETTPVDFQEIRKDVEKVLRIEGNEYERSQAWIRSGLIPSDSGYDARTWEIERDFFGKMSTSAEGLECHAYRFHQAATYHRYYMLKDLLPRFGIAAY